MINTLLARYLGSYLWSRLSSNDRGWRIIVSNEGEEKDNNVLEERNEKVLFMAHLINAW